MEHSMDETKLLDRITADSAIFDGKAIIRGQRLAAEHVLGMLAAGDTAESILANYPWLEPEDIQACLIYAQRESELKESMPDADGVWKPHEIKRGWRRQDLYDRGRKS